jgi:hypothetical protein
MFWGEKQGFSVGRLDNWTVGQLDSWTIPPSRDLRGDYPALRSSDWTVNGLRSAVGGMQDFLLRRNPAVERLANNTTRVPPGTARK